jgi:hypothetical protein
MEKLDLNIPATSDAEPKMVFRFLVKFPEKYGIPPELVLRANKPKWRDGFWGDMAVEFKDFVDGSVATNILASMIDDLSADSESELTYSLISLNSVGIPVEEWEVVSDDVYFDFGDLDYGVSAMQTCKLVVVPTRCTLKKL